MKFVDYRKRSLECYETLLCCAIGSRVLIRSRPGNIDQDMFSEFTILDRLGENIKTEEGWFNIHTQADNNEFSKIYIFEFFIRDPE